MTYAGEVSSPQAYEALMSDPTAVLVDCRTKAEWQFVGVPAIDRAVFVEWTRYPDNARNESFLEELAGAGIEQGRPVYFICRSGQRSRAAAKAATAAGYTQAFNVSDGFEGPLDGAGRRIVSGWKTNGLPWKQG